MIKTTVDRTGGPLQGITVLDLSAYIAGPYCCSLLADLGADVIKIESPSGDTLRQYPSTLEFENRAFLGVNRSKHGIVIDLKHPEGLGVLERLVARADVLVHNFRPSVPGRLGIGYEALRAVKADLIYCTLSGYGATGPLAQKAGYDQVLQSITGICASQGQGKPEPEIVYGSVVDFYAAALLSNAVCAALYHRARTGRGQALDVSLLGASLAMQSTRFVWADGEPRNVERDTRSGGVTGIHPCAEGTYLYLSANTPHFWKALCRLVGESQLAENPAYATVKQRAKNAHEILPRLRVALKKHTAMQWEELFGEEVPCGAVRPMEDMFDYQQVIEQDYVARLDHEQVGTYRAFSGAFRFGALDKPPAFGAPGKGQHTRMVLETFGFGGAEIDRLLQCGAIEGR